VGRAGHDGRSALGRLVAVSSRCFADEYWGRAPLLTRAEELAGEFDDLFSLEAADEILSARGLRAPFIRIAKDGAIVDTSRFTGSGGVGASVADQVLDERVLDLFAAGNTVVLQALHRFWPPLIEFTAALGSELGHPVQVNAYITPQQSQGFSAHYDVHDVFVLQIAGSKRWIVHEPVYPNPLRDQAWTQHRAAVETRATESPLQESVLTRGDVLYLPRGFIHSAQALGGVSVHLTIGVHNHTRNDLLRALLKLAADEPTLRQTLPMGVDVCDGAQIEADLRATVEALTKRLRSTASADVAKVLEHQLRGSSRPSPLGPLAQAQALAVLGLDTKVRIRPQQSATVAIDESSATVGYFGGTLTFPSSHGAALQRVLQSTEPIRVGDIPGLPDDQRLDLVSRLIRTGVVVAEPTR